MWDVGYADALVGFEICSRYAPYMYAYQYRDDEYWIKDKRDP